MSWTDHSAKWLEFQIKAHPEMDKPTLRKWCSKNYPFNQRSGWAYKAWLKALRAYFEPQSIRHHIPGKAAGPSMAELERAGQERLLP